MIFGLPEDEWFVPGHNACAGCGMAIAFRHILKAAGEDTIIVIGTGCGEVVSTPYPVTSWKHAVIHNAFENTASTASGVESALKMLGKGTKVLVIAGDGGTFDIGLGAISGMLERGHDICYVCYDNAAYANTGFQRSGATSKYTKTTTTPVGKVIRGKMQAAKNMPFIVAAHGSPYVATASISDPADLYKKVRKGIEIEGPCYIQVYSPCVPGWGIESSKTVQIAELAVKTCAYPLYEIEKGMLELNVIEGKKQLKEYFSLQKRFRHLLLDENKKLLDEVQRDVDSGWRELMAKNGRRFC